MPDPIVNLTTPVSNEPIVRFKPLRELRKGVYPDPHAHEVSGDWLLPFAPRDGRTRTVQGGNSAWLATGITLELPPNVVARVLYPIKPGIPGVCLIGAEIDARNNGQEIIIKVQNQSEADALIFYPGDHYFPLRLSRSDEFVLRAY